LFWCKLSAIAFGPIMAQLELMSFEKVHTNQWQGSTLDSLKQ